KADAIDFDGPAKRTRASSRLRLSVRNLLDSGNALLALALKRRFHLGNHVAPQLIELRHRHETARVIRPRQRREAKSALSESLETAAHRFFHRREVVDLFKRANEFALNFSVFAFCAYQ